MSLRLPTPPDSVDPIAVACDAFTVLGPGVWSSATAVVTLRPDGATLEHAVATCTGARPAVAPGNPEAYAAMLADCLAALSPPLGARASQEVRFTFTRESDGLTVEVEPVTPPLVKKLAHPGHGVLSPELVAALDAAMPAISAREEAWHAAADPEALPSFEGTTLVLGDARLPAHLLGVFRTRRCHLAWSWEIGGVARETDAAMRRVAAPIVATRSPRPAHDSTAYLLCWLAALELDARGVVPLFGEDAVMFVAAMDAPAIRT